MNFKPVTVALILMICSLPVLAWEHDTQLNDSVCETDYNADDQKIISDGEGGCYIVWQDDRHSGYEAIYAQHLDSQGAPLWTENGICALFSSSSIYDFSFTLGGSNDLWIVASCYIDGNYQLYVQRIGGNGTPVWDLAGNKLTSNINSSQLQPEIVYDELFGAIICWRDNRNYSTTDYDIYAQRIYYNGLLLWGDDGTVVCDAVDTQNSPMIILSEPGKSIIAWNDGRDGNSSNDVYAILLDENGNSEWDLDGVPLLGNTDLAGIVPDGFGGTLMTGIDASNYIQIKRVHSSGDSWWYIYVCNHEDGKYSPQIAPDGAGGAYVIWEDSRDDYYDGRTIYGQRIYGNGNIAWTENGVCLLAEDGSQDLVPGCLTTNSDGGILFSAEWNDNILSQKISSEGSRMWGSDGVVSASYIASSDNPTVCPDSNGGLIVTFESWRYGYYGRLYAQKIDRYGYPGDPAPTMDSVIDRPNDQGGEVIVSWNRSVYDTYANDVVDYYSLWMMYPDQASRSQQISDDTVKQISKLSGLPEEETRVMLDTGWTYVSEQEALHFEQYAINAPTYGDAIQGDPDPDITVYQVIAHDSYSGAFWIVPDSYFGYSIDNLSPGAPLMLNAESNGPSIELQWTSSGYHDEDLAEYNIYRSGTSGFTPAEDLFIGSASDTLFTDPNPPSGDLYYLVTAIDIHENEGDPSNEATVSNLSAVGDTPTIFAFRGAAPNPFNPATVIKLDIPNDGLLQVNIYDLRGTKIATLCNEHTSSGNHQFEWNGLNDSGSSMPSGVYFAQARCGESVSTLKLTLAK